MEVLRERRKLREEVIREAKKWVGDRSLRFQRY